MKIAPEAVGRAVRRVMATHPLKQCEPECPVELCTEWWRVGLCPKHPPQTGDGQ